MDQPNSILDKILYSKKTSEIEHFNPSEVVTELFKNLTSREEDVLRKRYGLLGKERETLENIGISYHVTRERIRQVEKSGIGKLLKAKNYNSLTGPIERTVFSVLEQHGGVMTEDLLLKELLQAVGDNFTNRQNIIFIISELLGHKFKLLVDSIVQRRAWYLIHAPLQIINKSNEILFQIIEKNSRPLTISDIIINFKKTDFYRQNKDLLPDDAIISYITIDKKISKNPFDEYGLTSWGSIVPKRMNDKIYLVLKKSGKPMHFTEIANKINEIKFDSRMAYPPTVHNELILNKQYVLVGRGIYALKEWGYQPGVVSTVLENILRNDQKALNREELVEKLLKQRMVKKNTIHLALANRSKFKKNSDNTYSLAS